MLASKGAYARAGLESLRGGWVPQRAMVTGIQVRNLYLGGLGCMSVGWVPRRGLVLIGRRIEFGRVKMTRGHGKIPNGHGNLSNGRSKMISFTPILFANIGGDGWVWENRKARLKWREHQQ